MDIEGIHKRSKAGQLEIKGGSIKKTTSYWVEAKEGWIYYYKDEHSTQEPVGTIPLTGLEIKLLSKKETKKADYAFQLTAKNKQAKDAKDKDWTFTVPSAEELSQWYSAVTFNIQLASFDIFGVDIEVLVLKSNAEVPPIVTKTIDYLKNHTEVEGIFRLSGSTTEVDNYRTLWNTGMPIDLSQCSNPHNVSNLLKLWLRELPDPLLQYNNYNKIVSIAKAPADTRMAQMKALVNELPKANQGTLKYLLFFLKTASEKASVSKMTALNLAVVFGPSIIKSREESLETAGNNDIINSLVEAMIQNPEAIFPAEAKKPPVAAPKAAAPPSLAVPSNANAQGATSPGTNPKRLSNTQTPGGSFLGAQPMMPGNASDELAAKLKARQNAPVPAKANSSPNINQAVKEAQAAPSPRPALKVTSAPGTPRPLPHDASIPAPITTGELKPSALKKSPSTDTILHPAQPPKKSPSMDSLGSAAGNERLDQLEEKMKTLEELQKKNADLVDRIKKHLS